MDGFRELPSDVVSEILTRTSFKTLDTCKCVCKEWRQLIRDPTFMPTYCKKTGNVCGFILHIMHHSAFISIDQPKEEDRSVLGLLPPATKILAALSNHGILCCTRKVWSPVGYWDKYHVCKPTTQQWQPLPSPMRWFPTVAVGMVTVGTDPLRYKIVRLSLREFARLEKNYNVFGCEVFNSTSWRWRQTQTVNLPVSETILGGCVYVGGSFHWLTSCDNILAFNEANGCFRKFHLPIPKHCIYVTKQLVDYRGELGLLCKAHSDGKIDLWAKEGGAQRNWRKKMTIDLTNLHASSSVYPLDADFHAGIILLSASDEVGFYNVGDGSFNRVKPHPIMLIPMNIFTFPFRSDFEPVDLGGNVG